MTCIYQVSKDNAVDLGSAIIGDSPVLDNKDSKKCIRFKL